MPRRPRDDYDDEDFDDRPRRRRRAEESDDEDDFDRPRAGRPSTAPTVLLILGGVFLASLLICGGVGLYVYRSMARGADEVRQQVQAAAERAQEQAREQHRQNVERSQRDQETRKRQEESGDKVQATKLMEQFVAELKADRADAAYKLTTADYQKRVPAAEFAKAAAVLASADARHVHMQGDFWAKPAGSTFAFDGTGPWNLAVKVTVIKDGDRWLVDRFTATKPDRPGPGGAADENSDKGKATKLMEQFVAELKADRPEAAYKLTNADFQKRTSLAEFKKVAARVSGQDGRGLSMKGDWGAAASGNVFVFDNFGGFLTVKVTVVKEGDRWLVDRFTASRSGGVAGSAGEDSDKGQAAVVAEQFVAELKTGRPDGAYKLTTPAFQKKVPLADFKKAATRFTGIHSHVIRVQPDHTAPAEGSEFGFDLFLGFGDSGRVTVARQGKDWRVDGFTVTGKGRP